MLNPHSASIPMNNGNFDLDWYRLDKLAWRTGPPWKNINPPIFDSLINYVSQGNVRRGSFAAYLPIDHPDIEEFLKIKSEGNSIQDLSIGVCITDDWLNKMIAGDKTNRNNWCLNI